MAFFEFREAGEGRQTEGGGSMAGNGGRGRGKGVVRLTRAGDGAPRAQTHAGRPDGTPLSPGSSVTVPLNIRRHPPSAGSSPPSTLWREMELTITQWFTEDQLPDLGLL